MSKIEQGKTERLQVRIDPETKRTLVRAAGHARQSVSQFVLEAAVGRAGEIIEKHEVTVLSDRDWTRFMDALDNPPQAVPALRKAMTRYQNETGG